MQKTGVSLHLKPHEKTQTNMGLKKGVNKAFLGTVSADKYKFGAQGKHLRQQDGGLTVPQWFTGVFVIPFG